MDVKEVAKEALTALRKTGIPHMLVGGVAVNYYGFPRATIDIDIVLELKGKKAADRLATALERADFEVDKAEVEMVVKIGDRFVASHSSTGQRIDFWLAKTEYNKRALRRRRSVRVFDTRAWICSPEDLIISKLYVGRARDYEDAVGVLHRQKGKLRMRYLMQQARKLNLDRELKKLLKEVKE